MVRSASSKQNNHKTVLTHSQFQPSESDKLSTLSIKTEITRKVESPGSPCYSWNHALKFNDQRQFLSNARDLDPMKTSCRRNKRPLTIRGHRIHPDRDMLKLAAHLQTRIRESSTLGGFCSRGRLEIAVRRHGLSSRARQCAEARPAKMP